MLLRRKSDKIDVLKDVPLFRGLSQRHLGYIATNADEVEQKAGQELTRQGALGREFLLILKGNARVERDGKVIARLGPGDFFGEMSLIDCQPRSASVIAETPITLLVVSSQCFSALLDTVPGLQRKILAGLCERLRAADTALAAMN